MSKVYFDRCGQSGNIFYIMGMAYNALLKEGRRADAEAMNQQVMAQHSYEDALEVIAEFVDLIDVSEEEV